MQRMHLRYNRFPHVEMPVLEGFGRKIGPENVEMLCRRESEELPKPCFIIIMALGQIPKVYQRPIFQKIQPRPHGGAGPVAGGIFRALDCISRHRTIKGPWVNLVL